jgi:hypothetical protein
MATATLSISYGNFSAPAGTVVANIVVTGTAQTAANSFTQTVPEGTATVTQVVAPDSYSVSVQAYDGSTPPNPIGTPVTTTFTVAATVTISIPVSVSAVVA